MRALVVSVVLVVHFATAAAEPVSPLVPPPPSQADADALARSGHRRLAAGIALIAVGVVGWGVSTAGTILSIVGYVKDARNECTGGACNTLETTGRWLGIGGGIAEAGGLGGGIPLLISGIHRLRQARRMRVGVALTPTGGKIVLGGSL